MKKIFITILLCLCIASFAMTAFAMTGVNDQGLNIKIISSKTLDGTAGDYVTVKGEIDNALSMQLSNITTYLSLVDTGTKLPVDLEDWSAEKGLFIGTIDPGQTLPLEWKIHFVKSGTYTLSIIANIEGLERPVTSVLTYFNVKQKKNLDPGHVLPVALGEPLLLLLAFGFLNYHRNKKTKDI
jgi:hypothetical protein